MPPKRDYTKAAAPLDAPPPPSPVWALAIIPTKRMGQAEHTIVALEVVGREVRRIEALPDANHDRLEEALRDFQRAAVRLYRFKQADLLLAGRA